ncbi:MAG: hypothetical protein JWM11_8056, partial [Planctomycetaceae bacterium]|nr:hypothetical protein [Planctomycetaceae bacterium]
LAQIPFTNLTKEVFRELHWTLTPWAAEYDHDDKVLKNGWTALASQANPLIEALATRFNMDPKQVYAWVDRAIEGRAGLPLLDCVCNSPLDSHKIDYVFHDWVNSDIVRASSKTTTEDEWLTSFVTSGQEILPSGLIGISGTSAERARRLLEERQWLYKHLYHLPAYRIVERIAKVILTLWLAHEVPNGLAKHLRRPQSTYAAQLTDSSAIKGCKARDLLWEQLPEHQTAAEAELILKMADALCDRTVAMLPLAPRAGEWILACKSLLTIMLDHRERRSYDEITQKLESVATWSERLYCLNSDLRRVREIIRHFESTSPLSVVFDVAAMPPILGYPRRKHTAHGDSVVAESIAVPHFDPDRWSRRRSSWVPLSETRFAQSEGCSWAQVIVVSPRPHDNANIKYAEDRFRHLCHQARIRLYDTDSIEGQVSRSF